MDAAAALGASVRAAVIALLLWSMSVASAQSQQRFAIVIAGASGDEVHAAHHDKWSGDLATAFENTFTFPSSNIFVLSPSATPGDGETTHQPRRGATAVNVRAVLGDLQRRVKREDVVVLVLLGHGTFDGEDAKFNLVGPDLTAHEWKQLLVPLPARVVVVNTTASSFTFLEELSQRGRVIITATDSVAQKFATVFPEHFVQALVSPGTDIDKDSRISIWDAFAATSAGIKRHYEQRGQLSTERPLLDDDGDRLGREAEAPGQDGAFARTIYLNPDTPAPARGGDATLVALEKQRSTLEAEIETLKSRKPEMTAEQYAAELERLLLQLARVAQQIRQRS